MLLDAEHDRLHEGRAEHRILPLQPNEASHQCLKQFTTRLIDYNVV